MRTTSVPSAQTCDAPWPTRSSWSSLSIILTTTSSRGFCTVNTAVLSVILTPITTGCILQHHRSTSSFTVSRFVSPWNPIPATTVAWTALQLFDIMAMPCSSALYAKDFLTALPRLSLSCSPFSSRNHPAVRAWRGCGSPYSRTFPVSTRALNTKSGLSSAATHGPGLYCCPYSHV